MKTFPSPHNNRLPGNFAWLRRFLAGTSFVALLLSFFLIIGQAKVGASQLNQESLLLLVSINEISWGGTQADGSAGQWIELYNSDTAPVNITGWVLAADDGIPVIALNGTIPANGYFLLARRSDVFSSIPVNQVFLDPLQATGETLRLYNDIGGLVDTANINGGPWPAGIGFPSYASMERNANQLESDASWITFAGTPSVLDRDGNPVSGSPGQANWALGMTQTPSPTPTHTPTYTQTPTFTPTLTPTQTFTPSPLRSVIINEVAWMGTIANPDHEWIELYNPGPVDLDLSGWRILVDDVVFITIPSGKVIESGRYFLLLRYEDALQFEDTSILGEQNIYVYPSDKQLLDTGQRMKLRAPGQNIDIDTANAFGTIAWPEGNSTTKCSMERNGVNTENNFSWFVNPGIPKVAKDVDGNWICGSPGYRNWAYDVRATPTSVGPTRTPTATRVPTRIPPARISQVIINEFLPFPGSDWNNDGKVDFGDEFIELMNVGNISVNLQGWRLDDQAGDSSPYTIGAINLAPGARIAFFASETGILLSNRTDSVRLFQPNGVISDAFTYTTVPTRDQSWCRLPDGSMDWTFGCEPTPGLLNKLAETIFRAERDLPSICKSPLLPAAIFRAECQAAGQELWVRWLWDGFLPVFQVFFERNGQEHWFE